MSSLSNHRFRPLTMALAVLVSFAIVSVSAPAARAAEPIKIGFSMALTGALAGAGKAALVAMEIWRDDVNEKGGLLGRPVEFIYYDDATTPSKVPGIYTKLLNIDKVDLVVCHPRRRFCGIASARLTQGCRNLRLGWRTTTC